MRKFFDLSDAAAKKTSGALIKISVPYFCLNALVSAKTEV